MVAQFGALGLGDQLDHAGTPEYGRSTDQVGEMLEDGHAAAGQVGRQGVAVGLVDQGGRLAAAAGAEEGFFDQHDAAGPALGQMEGDADAENATTDNEDVTGMRHRRLLTRRRPSPASRGSEGVLITVANPRPGR